MATFNRFKFNKIIHFIITIHFLSIDKVPIVYEF